MDARNTHLKAFECFEWRVQFKDAHGNEYENQGKSLAIKLYTVIKICQVTLRAWRVKTLKGW